MQFREQDRQLLSALVSRKEAVVRAVRDAILDGRLEAGSRLNQDEIAAELGVSRMPVREALKDLEAEGLVTFYPYRGVEVTKLNISDIEELFSIRVSLEQLAMTRAVENLTEEDLAEMRRILERMDRCLQPEENVADDWMALNHEFHTVLNRACDWPRLIEMINSLRGNVERYVRMYLSIRGREKPQRQHWQIYEACSQRNVRMAQDLIGQHLTDTAGLLIQALSDQNSGGRGTAGRSADPVSDSKSCGEGATHADRG